MPSWLSHYPGIFLIVFPTGHVSLITIIYLWREGLFHFIKNIDSLRIKARLVLVLVAQMLFHKISTNFFSQFAIA